MKRFAMIWSLGAAGFLFAIAFGLWSKSLFTVSESVHFTVNFPASSGNLFTGESASDVSMDCHDSGSPMAGDSTSMQQMSYTAGGISARGNEGYILIDVGQEGLLKRLIQPRFFNLSSHWVRNVGDKPYKVRMEMNLCDIDLEWETPEAAWDQTTQSTTRYIDPGQTFNMDWYFHIPPEAMQQRVVCRGQLKIFDAEAGDLLSVLPISILNSRVN